MITNFVNISDYCVIEYRLTPLGEYSPELITSTFYKLINDHTSSRQIYNTDGNLDDLVRATVAGGFQNVIDAFHNIGSSSVLHKFFIDERKVNKGIRITDEFSKLVQFSPIKPLPRNIYPIAENGPLIF